MSAQRKGKKKTQASFKPISYHEKEPNLRIIKSEYVISAVSEEQYPEGDTVEVAFLGRSNVGKSSLINSLCNYRGLALVSGTPGKTKTINFFSITSKEVVQGEDDVDEEYRYDWFLVDLPGYGYAKTGKGNQDRQLWANFIADYIKNSPRLSLLCLLIDGRHPTLPIDQEAFAWLQQAGVPIQIVVTKVDKLTNREKQLHITKIENEYPTDRRPIAYSALKHTGRTKLIERINEVITGV